MRPIVTDDVTDDKKIERGLGWFSLALGAAEVLMPRTVSRLAGVPTRPTLLRALGLREMGAGAGVFAARKPVGALWARVMGDAVDVVFLLGAALSPRSKRGRLTLALAAVAAVTALDVRAAKRAGAAAAAA